MPKEKIRIPYKEPLSTEETKTMMAGIERVDITPPPGMPASGYAIASCCCYGFRTKLKARIFYLKPKKGRPVTLVQCDLLSGSLLIHHKVASLIAGETDVDSAGLAICGTHTHSGPGNYFESEMYNTNASNKPGLEKSYMEFCSKQIADGIIRAYRNRKPAKIATATTEIWNATVNRSLQPYLQNENIKKLKEKPDALQAINPYLHLIRVDCLNDSGKYQPAGLFTNFSIHPNTCPVELGGLFSGDVIGFFELQVEKEIKEKYKLEYNPVHGSANYNHGDCNTNHDQHRVENFKDLRSVAKIMSEKTLDLFYSLDKKTKSDVKIKYRAKEIDILEDREIEGIRISERGYAGMSLPSGARGRGRTTLFDKIPVLFSPGRPRKCSSDDLQGAKRVIGGPLQKLILPTKTMPHILFLQVIQIHDTILIPLPWEVTQEIGRRIGEKSREMGEKAGIKGIKRFVVTDISNGYFGYVTTPEEYSIQYYEGGSNLYGPNTGPYVAAMVGKLTEEMVQNDSGGYVMDLFEEELKVKKYYPDFIQEEGRRELVKAPRFYALPDHEESYWSFKWHDVPPGKINFHEQLLEIEVSRDGKKWKTLFDGAVPVDDNGADLAVIYHKKLNKDKMGLYEARWFNPPQDNLYYRFKVLPRGKQDVFYSPPVRMRNKKSA